MSRPMQVLATLLAAAVLAAPFVDAERLQADRSADDTVDGNVLVYDVLATSLDASSATMTKNVDCKVSAWQVVKECDAVSPVKIMKRSIVTPPLGKGCPCPSLMETQRCEPVDCVMTAYGPWGDCDSDGYKTRTRTVEVSPLYGGRECRGLVDKVKCSPRDCLVSPWSDWVCNSATGNKTRTRTATREQQPSGAACPLLVEATVCDPINCQLKSVDEDTDEWGCCQFDGTAGNNGVGYQTKVLGIKTQPLYNGTACPGATDPRRLAVQPCVRPIVGKNSRNVTATLDVIAYNDVYELLQDTVNGLKLGGPSRVVPIAKEMRARNPNSLVLFAGDTMSPSLWSSQFKGMQMVAAHNAIGVDYASLGNHEFDYGIDNFLNVSAATKFPWLNANCYEAATGKLLRNTAENAIKEFDHPTYGKLKVGLFGVMYDMKDANTGLYWTDPLVAAKQQVAILKAAGVDMIIALTHQDLADDNRMSKEVAGINMIYGGHDHASMLQTNFGTPYVKADFDFRSIWTSHIEYYAKDKTNAAMFLMEHTAVPITEDMPTDAALDATISNYNKTIGELFSRVVGSLCAPLDLTNKVVRSMDAPIGHVFANSIMAFYGAGSGDVVVQNGGAIRSDTTYPAGPLTLGQIMAWSPFGNTVMIVETDGASLKKFIAREMVGSCGDKVVILNGLYVHTAGVKYTFKCTGVKAGALTSLEWLDHPTRSGHVQDAETFKLVLNDFLYKSEFTVIPGVTFKTLVKEVEARRMDEALELYVTKQTNADLCESDKTIRTFVSF